MEKLPNLGKIGPRTKQLQTKNNLGVENTPRAYRVKTNVMLLANVFEEFRNTCINHYGLDPANFYTSPGLAWKACLKKMGIGLELLTDPDML